MKGTIIGFEPVDYTKKGTEERVKGIRLVITYKSGDVFGLTSKEEFIRANTPFYNKFFKNYLENDLDEAETAICGGSVFIDYNVIERGSATFKEIVEFEFTPNPAESNSEVSDIGKKKVG